jgi:monovalent cation:proton antiporter-2 (CPA2) family protein
MNESFLLQAFVFLLAAVISVPLAKRLGLGWVLGYLVAGIAVGPHFLGLVGHGGGGVMEFAEFGVVMMLFVVGMELRPALLWQLRGSILGMGGAQVAGTTAVVAAVAVAAGMGWREGIAVGMNLAMSTTAMVLHSFNEKGLLKTPGGQACFSVLLFQDIAVIPILALMPLLAAPWARADAPVESPAAAWLHAALVLGAVASVVLAGRFLLRPIFRIIAATRLQEVFTATALLLVVGVTLLMNQVGLSASLGTFLAGVVLADSEYRHQLEADIEPFKGLLLGLFFIAVGAGIDFSLLLKHPQLIAGLVTAMVLVKFAVLNGVGRLFRLQPGDNYLFSFGLAQGGEFAFVLLAFATGHHILTLDQSAPLVLSVAISLAITPLLLILNEKFVAPRFFATPGQERPQDEIAGSDNPVILAGFGRFGQVVGRLLRANGVGTTILDFDSDQVDLLRRFGLKSFYGDASRLDLLRAAGAQNAAVFIVAIDDEEKSLEIVKLVQKEFPHLRILARAVSRAHAYDLIHLGVAQVYHETLGSSLDLGVNALRAVGFRAKQAYRAAQIFRQHEQVSIHEMAAFKDDHKAYISKTRQDVQNLESLLQRDAAKQDQRAVDAAWDAEAILRVYQRPAHGGGKDDPKDPFDASLGTLP